MNDEHAVPGCPPHHWLIGGERSDEQWCCQKCGLLRRPARRVVEARRLANVSTWSRDEIALAEPWEE